jgi:phage RecT family recombinase
MSKELSIAQKQELVKKQNFQEQIQKTNKAFIEIYGEKGQKVFTREQQYAVMSVQKNPEILNCTPNSIYSSVAAVAMTGLTLDPIKQLAHLIPRKGVCTLVVDYKGILELLHMDTGVICSSGAVYDCDIDVMDFKEGVGGYVNAKRPMPRPEQRKLLYCYNIANFPDGRTHCHIMDKEQIDKRRGKAQTDAVWNEWEEKMNIKTVIRDHYKYLPKSDRLDKAMSLVDEELPKFEKKTNDDDDFLNDDVQTPEGSITIEPDTSNTENQ